MVRSRVKKRTNCAAFGNVLRLRCWETLQVAIPKPALLQMSRLTTKWTISALKFLDLIV
jgi:hypothetical protein